MSALLESLHALLLGSAPPEEALSAPLFSGRIEGGWGYIWFSYALVWASLLAYALYLLLLRRQLKALSPEGKGEASSSPPAA